MRQGEDMRVEMIADYRCHTGENPLWHPQSYRLYWTDIPTGRIFQYDPKSGEHAQIYSGRPVGGFTFQADGGLLLFRDRGNVALWRDGELEEVIPEIPEEIDSRFNDVIADPVGRVFCGTMSSDKAKGRLYRLDLDGRVSPVLAGIGCSNGMGFSTDLRAFYYTDSFAGEIYQFHYNAEDGALSNRQIFATVPKADGLPDGLTVDADGAVWSALWDGSGIIRFDDGGNINLRVQFPARKVSSLTFGGETLQDIYVTTAGGHTKDEDGDLAGALFRYRCKAFGRAEFVSRIQIPSRGSQGSNVV